MDRTSYTNLYQLVQQITQSSYEDTLHFNNPISFPLIFLFLFLFFLLSLKLLSTRNTKIKLPPSPPQLPIIGNLHQLGSLPHRSVASLSEKYGPLILLKLGQIPTLVVSSAKLAKEVVKSHDNIFSNRAQNTAAKSLLYGCRDLVFASYGEQWREARKLCAMELLSAKRNDFFQHVRDEEVAELVKKIGGDSSTSVNLNKLLMSTSNNIMGRCVLGEKFEDENNRFREVTRKTMVLLTAFCVGDAFPWFGWIDVLRGFHGQLKATFEKLDRLFEEVIEEHKEKMKSGDDPSCEKDFVGIMLKLQQHNTLDYHFTMKDFKAILLDMLLGGTVSNATNLEWTMAELMRNPTVLKKVQEEVRAIVGKKAKIETNDTEKMEYMKCVIKESLRLHPPTPLLLPRETLGSVNLEGYQIPSKTKVWINAWAVQRDPKISVQPREIHAGKEIS